jgi:hypothetical protein
LTQAEAITRSASVREEGYKTPSRSRGATISISSSTGGESSPRTSAAAGAVRILSKNDKSSDGSFLPTKESPADRMELDLDEWDISPTSESTDGDGRQRRQGMMPQSRSMFGQFLADRLAEEMSGLETRRQHRLERARRQRHSLVDLFVRNLSLKEKEKGGGRKTRLAEEEEEDSEGFRSFGIKQNNARTTSKDDSRNPPLRDFYHSTSLSFNSSLSAAEGSKKGEDGEACHLRKKRSETMRFFAGENNIQQEQEQSQKKNANKLLRSQNKASSVDFFRRTTYKKEAANGGCGEINANTLVVGGSKHSNSFDQQQLNDNDDDVVFV